MTFGAPHWLWLLLLGLPIVALYTRRPRRPLVRVSALWLWTDVPGAARAPTRRLLGRLDERLLALLLLLLALLGTTLGLSRPGEARPRARALAVVVDVGVSMGVRDGAPARARLERAHEALARLEAGRGPDSPRWVIVAGASPRLLAAPGDALTPGTPRLEGGRADLAAGLALARAALEGADAVAEREVWLLTATPPARAGAAAGADLRVVDLRARPAPAIDLVLGGSLTRLDAGHVRLHTTVENRGRTTTAALVEVRLDGAPLVRERPQPIAPGDALAYAPRDLPCPQGGVVEVRLASGSHEEALTWVVPPPRRLRVALDDPRQDPFLSAALAADPQVERVHDAGRADVLVTTTSGAGARGVQAVLRVGPGALGAATGLAVVGALPPLSPRLTSPAEPALDLGGLDLEDRLVAGAPRVEVGPGWRVLVRAGEGDAAPPLLLCRDEPHLREVALVFDPAGSDLVLGRAFPLLVARALRWAARHEEPEPRWTRAGEVATLDRPPGETAGEPAGGRARALGPDRAPVPLALLPDGRSALRLEAGPGAYHVGPAPALVAAHPAARPVEDALPADPGPGLEGLPRAAPPSDWAGACVLLALLALLVEATVFHRRGLP